MLRAMFFAMGTFAALAGGVLFQVDRVVLTSSVGETAAARSLSSPLADGRREVDPPSWLPYTLASTGVLTMLYALALPKKGA
jgi:hypothetical protein